METCKCCGQPLSVQTKAIKIGIIVGHEKKAPGADLVDGTSEYTYNSEIAKLAFDYGDKLPGVDVEIFLRDNIGISGAYSKARAAKCDCVIELHFNSFNRIAFGTETLCSSDSHDMSFAQAVQDQVKAVFGRTHKGTGDRGLKVMDQGRGAESCTSFPGKANCLVEPFFGDNAAEAKMAVERKRLYAEALINASVSWLTKTQAKGAH